jgi:branched-subunit amino acid aminotransferase/4-amino-4-deoxychorismate lyase
MTQSTIFNYAIFNGKLMPVDQATISIFNQAFFSSFGVYEAVKVDAGRPFYLQNHLHRLLESAQQLDLQLEVTAAILTAWFDQLAALDRQATWSLRILALGAADSAEAPIVTMQPVPLPTYAPELYQTGASAILYEGQRMLPGCKSLNTLVNYLARRTARQQGALEGLLHHHGHLTEGARSNLFAVRQGQLVTPSTDQVLSGITRDVILHVMQDTGTPIIEAPLPIDLSLYEEVFISSTSMHVMPLTTIDHRPVGSGQVGPVTRRVMEKFNAYYRDYMNLATSQTL